MNKKPFNGAPVVLNLEHLVHTIIYNPKVSHISHIFGDKKVQKKYDSKRFSETITY